MFNSFFKFLLSEQKFTYVKTSKSMEYNGMIYVKNNNLYKNILGVIESISYKYNKL